MRLFTLLTLVFIISKSLLAQDSIPNGGFERWTQGGASFFDPDGWNTPNPLTGGLSITTTSPDSAAVHSGHFSVRMETKTGAGFIIPGLVTTGALDPLTQQVWGGILIHSRPLALLGWYQYTPVTDTAGAAINLLDSLGHTIGSGYLGFSTATTGWTSFAIPITYTANTIPDTSQILITSSYFHGTVGSVLLIDDVSYSYFPAGINEKGMVQVRVYPNPVNDIEFFSIDNTLELKNPVMQFYNAGGQQVKEVKEIGSHSFSVDTKNLPVGYYTYQLLNDGKLAGTGKIMVQR